METDWQEGKPPSFIEVEVWTKNGNVRRGERQGGWFVLLDNTHPLQNAVLDSDLIEQWRLYIGPPTWRPRQFADHWRYGL